MKFTDYIIESSKRDMAAYGVIQTLKKHAMPFIKELRKVGKNHLVWRGTSKITTKSITPVTPRQDRIPKDMSEFAHEDLDGDQEVLVFLQRQKEAQQEAMGKNTCFFLQRIVNFYIIQIYLIYFLKWKT